MERPSPSLDLDAIRRAPKVLLHDHLDGGLRPRTVLELASEIGYRELPTTDPDELGRWFTLGADRKSLELYLEGFRHTVAVMQTRDAIERVAAECVEDLAADGVVYAEVRMAPGLLTDGDLSLDDAVSAMLAGFRRGSEGRPITVGLIVTAMRQAAKSVEIAELAVRHRDAGVVGFDIAGPEAGYPPTRHLDAFNLIAHENFHFTIHAGEGTKEGYPFEPEQIRQRMLVDGRGVRLSHPRMMSWSGPFVVCLRGARDRRERLRQGRVRPAPEGRRRRSGCRPGPVVPPAHRAAGRSVGARPAPAATGRRGRARR